jgi:nucleoside-diphosphate-sugar epimerase
MTRAVLVTGGGGFVGTRLAGFLLAKDCRVRTLDLEPLDAPELAGRVDHLRGDIRDRALLQRAASGCDLVVHAAAALPLWPPEEIRSVNVDGTAAVVEACAALGIPRLVNISTTAVYGMPDREGLLETDALAGSDPYSRSKIQAEEIAARFRDRLCVPTLRAKLIAGPGRLGIFDVIFDWVRRGKHVPIIGAGNNPYQMLHVDDLCDAVWAAAMAPAEAANDTFNIAAARFETVREDYQGLLRHVGHGRRVIGIPALPLVLLLAALSVDHLRRGQEVERLHREGEGPPRLDASAQQPGRARRRLRVVREASPGLRGEGRRDASAAPEPGDPVDRAGVLLIPPSLPPLEE